MEELTDIDSEKAIIGYLINNTRDEFVEMREYLNSACFVNNECQAFFACLENAYIDKDIERIDYPTISTISSKLHYSFFTNKKKFDELRRLGTEIFNPSAISVKLRRLAVYRAFSQDTEDRLKKVSNFTGDESIAEFLAIIEHDIEKFINTDAQYKNIGDGLKERIKERLANPVKQIGISTGYERYDESIGGGLRDGSVNVVCARIKVGKSQFLNNVALNVATAGVDVLYLDTEMSTAEQQDRCLANLSDISITDIERGSFGEKEFLITKVDQAVDQLISLPYTHVNVSGIPFEEQYAIISSWVKKKQKPDANGHIKKVVVIYDYLKMTDQKGISNNVAEHQVLGFMMTSFHNLAMKYQFPILTAVQSNRDGIDKETTGIAAGSDRILWLCTSFALFKEKSSDEISEDGILQGNRRLSVLATRHGPGTTERDYINFTLFKEKAKLVENKRRSEIVHERQHVEVPANGEVLQN